ncbi:MULTISPECIES: hypothetical protein [unclassified Streptomyces]|uniref:hypothetical protein n=1 Tax=unclassified Streptomyces TaxID=2593676 RepID=UPI000AEBFB80|nr:MULTISPECIES: hypothetical protein [unclassified Streptomyces]
MNYTEKYELREIHGNAYTVIDRFDTESEAVIEMGFASRRGPGNWQVVRLMEVSVASVIKA